MLEVTHLLTFCRRCHNPDNATRDTVSCQRVRVHSEIVLHTWVCVSPDKECVRHFNSLIKGFPLLTIYWLFCYVVVQSHVGVRRQPQDSNAGAFNSDCHIPRRWRPNTYNVNQRLLKKFISKQPEHFSLGYFSWANLPMFLLIIG